MSSFFPPIPILQYGILLIFKNQIHKWTLSASFRQLWRRQSGIYLAAERAGPIKK